MLLGQAGVGPGTELNGGSGLGQQGHLLVLHLKPAFSHFDICTSS